MSTISKYGVVCLECMHYIYPNNGVCYQRFYGCECKCVVINPDEGSELQQFLSSKLNHQDLVDLLRILIDIEPIKLNMELTRAIDYSLAEKEEEG